MQDFYTHSNWTSLVGPANTGKPFKDNTILDAGYDLPQFLAPGQLLPGNQPGIDGKRQVMLVSSSNSEIYEQTLKPAVELNYTKIDTKNLGQAIKDLTSIIQDPKGFLPGGNTLGLQKNLFGIDDNKIYWRVDSTLSTQTDVAALKDPVLKATFKNGQDVFGLASGATWDLVYKDQEYNVPLVDTNMLGMTTARALYAGFDHGGMAGTANMLYPDPYNPFNPLKKYNAYLGPMSRDSDKVPGHEEALYFATLQTRHEWDRLGNLIFARYGEAGLRRFAEFALGSEYQQKYIDTYKTAGGKWTDWPLINQPEPQRVYFSADYQSIDSSAPRIDFRFINVVSYNPSEKGFTSQLQLQFSPADDGIEDNWTDSANTDTWYKLDRHGDGLTKEIIQQLIIPKTVAHTEEETRAFWTGPNNDDNSDGFGTIYYIESRNPIIPISIPSFKTGIDKIVLVDNNGKRGAEIGARWGDKNYKSGVQEAQQKYNIFINSAPAAFKTNPAWIISKNDLVKADGTVNGLSYSASSIFRDIDQTISPEQSLSFAGLASNAPFLKLVDGKLVASADIRQYAGQEFEATLNVTDGAGGGGEDTVRVVVDPTLKISNLDSIQPGQAFDLKFNKQASQIYSIYTAIDINNGSSDLEYFTLLSSTPGNINGNPVGYDPLSQRVEIGSTYDTGTVTFYLRDSQTDSPVELQVSKISEGSYQLKNGSELVATLIQPSSTSTPDSLDYSVDRFSLINTAGTVAGFRTEAPIGNGIVLNYSTYSSASYTSKIGFYLTDVRYGTIVDPLTGQMSSPNLQQLSSAIDQYSVFESDIVANNSSAQAFIRLDSSIDARNIVFTPYFKTNTGQSTYLYGCDAALNPDGFDHIAKMGLGQYGFEDMYGGGDKDFNDVLFRFNSIQSLT